MQLLPGPRPCLHARTQPQMTLPLSSAPITGASQLLRAGPPSAPEYGTQSLTVSAAGEAPSRHSDQGSSVQTHLLPFHADAADQAHVASTPDTAWPISRHPSGSSRDHLNAPVLMSAEDFRRFSSERLPRPPPDASSSAFSSSLTTTVFSQRSMRSFEASPCSAAPAGPVSSIVHAAPHQRTLSTSSPLCVRDTHKRSWIGGRCRGYPGSGPTRNGRPRYTAYYRDAKDRECSADILPNKKDADKAWQWLSGEDRRRPVRRSRPRAADVPGLRGAGLAVG